ncbi:MAG: GTP cyclohydrolase I FolE [Deltaproteobacteria bacterium]|nr:GTP cyclohydrolase I FolE [Deltaproteobacteria bacterium]
MPNSQLNVIQFQDKHNDDAMLKDSVVNILCAIGEDHLREGLIKTPERFSKAFRFLTKGYQEDPYEIINNALFDESVSEMVIVKDIEVYSLCEHHLLPFFGKAHVGYLPNGKIIGLSKIARIVDIFARRLQVQERMTRQIAVTLDDCLNPLGVAVVIEASHMCMQMRGVQKQNSAMVTSAMLGEFEKPATRNEFMNMIKGRSS